MFNAKLDEGFNVVGHIKRTDNVKPNKLLSAFRHFKNTGRV